MLPIVGLGQQLASFQLLFRPWNGTRSPHIACNKTEKARQRFPFEDQQRHSQCRSVHMVTLSHGRCWDNRTGSSGGCGKVRKKMLRFSEMSVIQLEKCVFLGQAEVRLVCWMISCSKIEITIKGKENDALCVSAMSCISLINFRRIKPRFESTFHHVHGIRCIRFFHH